MSWKASAHIRDLVICPNGERITRSEKMLALILADYHQIGRPTFPSIPNLAIDSLMDERQARRVIKSLERKGVLVRVYPTAQGRGATTYYRFPGIEPTPAEEGGQNVPLLHQKKGGMQSPPSVLEKGGKKGDILARERGAEGGQKGDILPPPYIEEQEQELNTNQEQGNGGSPAADALLKNNATDVARAVMDDTGLAGPWIDNAIRVQAEFEMRTTGIGIDDLRAVMAEAWQEYERCAKDGKLRMAMMGAQKFYAEGKWRSPRLWGLKTGMKAYGG